MKIKHFKFDITLDEFRSTLSRAIEKIEWKGGVKFVWFRAGIPLSPKWEIRDIPFPIKKVNAKDFTKIIDTMATFIPDQVPEFYLTLKSWENYGYFGLRNAVNDDSTLYVDCDDDHKLLFEDVFDRCCSLLEKRRSKPIGLIKKKSIPQVGKQIAIYQLSCYRIAVIKRTGQIPILENSMEKATIGALLQTSSNNL